VPCDGSAGHREPAEGRDELPPHEVQAACYGIGAIYPVAIIDEVHRWERPARPGNLPEQQPEKGHGMLVLRWTGPQSEEATAPALLAAAAATAPAVPPTRSELAAYQDSLPAGLYLIALPAELVLGPWEQRPGVTRPIRRPHPAVGQAARGPGLLRSSRLPPT
jgi:hypothetical protein